MIQSEHLSVDVFAPANRFPKFHMMDERSWNLSITHRWQHVYRCSIEEMLRKGFPACWTVIGCWRMPRFRKMTGSRMSPHCTHRVVTHSSSPALFRRSADTSLTIKPPHLRQDEWSRAEERADWLVIWPTFSFCSALAMMTSIGLWFNVCRKYV